MTASAWFRVTREIRTLLAFVVLSFLTNTSQGQTKPIFPILPSYPTGAQALAGTAGDFNGDGQPDFAVITIPYGASTLQSPPPPETLTVYLNQGPTIAPTPVVTTSLTCLGASSMMAADLNNDKKLDLVFNCVPSYVAVLLGNGDGTFQTPAYYAVNGAQQLATPVDLNGDGYLDIALLTFYYGSSTTTNVAVLLNKGSSAPGVLSAPTTYASPVLLDTIGTGDFNGDGKQDIVAGDSQLEVFYGNGDGTLQAPQAPQPTPNNGTGEGAQLFASDFNHDGITDVAYLFPLSGSIQGELQVLLGSTNGQFMAGPVLTLPASGTLVAAGSTNGGSNLDLAVVSADTTILMGDGKGGFAVGQSYAITSNIVSPSKDSNGNTDLVFVTADANAYENGAITNYVTLLKSNGDGTFQGPPNSATSSAFIAADVNGDGLTDILYENGQNFVTALGRGNGTFSISSQNSSNNAFSLSSYLATGDFNGDGKLDVVSVFPGTIEALPGDGTGPLVVYDAEFYYYQGDGDGAFQPSSTGVDLGIIGVQNVVVGDFNGDGHPDVVVFYTIPPLPDGNDIEPSPGLLFIAGKGDGTFAQPPIAQQISLSAPTGQVLSADLRNNGKLDLIWSGTVYLGNGDGTFTQIPLTVTGTPLAVGDVNGDGFPDIVIGNAVYAGNGDGTFQTTPFFTATGVTPYNITAANIGDINADGHADLLLQTATLNVFLGDGKGDFTADPNTYYAGTYNPPSYSGPGIAVLARLNNQAPALPNDTALDYLVYSNGGATSLLNQFNPAPTAPAPVPSGTRLTAYASSAAPNQSLTFTATIGGISPTGTVSFMSGSTALGTAPVTNGAAVLSTAFAAVGSYSVTASYPGDSNNSASSSNAVSVSVAAIASKTTLTVSAMSANPAQQLSFTATVTGFNPTGSVTFVAGSTTLGTAPVTNGTATLSSSFAAEGSYTITANYAGDIANLPSSSNAVSVSVLTPDFTVSASPTAATVTAGQTATIVFSVTPVGGYSGTVKFSCGTLPSGVTCSFTPASVTPANGTAATTTLSVATTAPSTAMMQRIVGPIQGIAWAGMICLAFSPTRQWRSSLRFMSYGVLLILLMSGLMALSGCSSGSPTITSPGTPKGTQTITVSIADEPGGQSHTVPVQITVQ
jgi:hypothetical protein